MRRRKNIIISAITCMFSICLMMFGVYAASNPNVSINGQVSYTARDASVLVQGKMYGADGYESVDYKTVTDPTSPTTDDVLTNSVSQYVDYTSADQNKTTLATWNLGDQLKFYEDENGIRKVNVCLKFTNLSNYPVMATAVFENKTATNVKTTQSPTDGKMAMTTIGSVGSDCEMSFAFEVEDDSKNANIDFKLVVTIEKTVLQSYTATFSSGTKQFSNQSNATSYDVAETTVLEEAPELYFVENEGNRRVALWYDNQECQGEPIKFPYVLTSNKTFYAVWEQNTKIFNFFDYGKDIQVMFDGYNAFRAQSIMSVGTVFMNLQKYADVIQVEDRTLLLLYSENILGIKFYNNFLYDMVDNAIYIVPSIETSQAKDILPTKTAEEYKSLRIGYVMQYNGDTYTTDGYIELKFVAGEIVNAPNVQIYNSGSLVDAEIGFNATNTLANLTKYTATFHTDHEQYKFITGTDSDNKYVTTTTKTEQISLLSKLNNSIVYSSIGDEQTTGDQVYVAEWFDNPELSGEPISLPYTLTKNTDLYAKWGYNSKTYNIDTNAKNIELWLHGKRIFKAKDTSVFPSMFDDSTNEIKKCIVKDSDGSSLFSYYEFNQSEKFDYVDQNFKIIPEIFFPYDTFEDDWNPIDWDKLGVTGGFDLVRPGFGFSWFHIYKRDNTITFDFSSLFGDASNEIIVYADGVEAQYTLANSKLD